MRSTALTSLGLLVVLTAGPTQAQKKDTAAGFGSPFVGPLNVSTPARNQTMLGVVHLGGKYYVSGARVSVAPVGKIYVFDEKGKLTGSFNQPAQVTSQIGMRDGATDGASLMFGSEFGIHVLDTSGKLTSSVQAKNGVQILSANPIKAVTTPPLTVHRAVAYNPAGNGGKGSLWVGDFGSQLVEIDLAGRELKKFSAGLNTPTWSIYGLAYDPVRNSLWASSAPNAGPIQEIDATTGKYTRNRIERSDPSSPQGGCSPVAPAQGYTLGGPAFYGLVALDQGTRDQITCYRIDRYPGIRGENEAVMLSSVGTGTPDPGSPKLFRPFTPTIGYAYDLSGDPSLLNRAGVIAVNALKESTPNGASFLPELVALFPFSTPAGNALLVPTLLVKAANAVRFPIPKFAFPPGPAFRFQTVYLDSRAPIGLIPTNQVKWDFADTVLLAKAEGDNSFNAITSSGFFSVTNFGSVAITEFTFDWVGATGQGTMLFDLDQNGMADSFWFGNSTSPGSCKGTYRNGSDVAAGLVYDTLNTYKGQITLRCAGNCGFIASNQVNLTPDFKTLRFRFSGDKFKNGVKFEFDCDTDFGAGIDGGSMAGMKVMLKLADNKVVTGALAKVNAKLSEFRSR